MYRPLRKPARGTLLEMMASQTTPPRPMKRPAALPAAREKRKVTISVDTTGPDGTCTVNITGEDGKQLGTCSLGTKQTFELTISV
jgi:hypothetical protein